MPTVAIASEFLTAFARIPQAQQKRVREFTEKFQSNPTSPSINYEKIHGMRDPKVRTVRVSLSYRAIILHPERGDVYVLVWVDHHDEAMAWAKEKTFEINPNTGALQVVSVVEAERSVSPAPHAESRRSGLFDDVETGDLLSLGVPEVLTPAVRAVQDREQLNALARHLPEEAAEALTWLAEGFSPDEVRSLNLAPRESAAVDTQDFEKALENPDTRRRFVTVESQHDLAAMLDAPLEKWRVFLHPTQARLVTRHFNGPARVLGGAGTGKTVVAMHRARHLASKVFTDESDRVLFLTFTANLAKHIEQNLRTLCGEEIDRIEVSHLHSWAVRFMRPRGYVFDVATDEEAAEYWRLAAQTDSSAGWDLGFIRQEWDRVVQTHDIRTKDEYLRVSRVGRGKTLSRPDRARLWGIFEAYRKNLEELGKAEWLDIIRDTRRFIEMVKPVLPYRAAVVDEAQDLHAEEWKLIRRLVPPGPNDLFIVGDAHQRIYDRKVILSKCGIDVRGRSGRLHINYRTTEQIRGWAVGLLCDFRGDDLDAGTDEQAGYLSLLSGPPPEVRHFETQEEEAAFIGESVRRLVSERRPEDICLVAPSKAALKDTYQRALKAAGVEFTVLEKTDDRRTLGVRLATMHRVKGLEFPCMILAGVNEGTLPRRLPALADDPIASVEHEERQRSLLFVAATRARDRLIITSSGRPSPFLPKQEQ
ncbi:MAG TPA: UvrD-helicase domain-containing protein [Pyrinomonadaceae bacterium]|nr:UvrD-helicase domain-containing protein [Pyrinomonadaceae bacterium]